MTILILRELLVYFVLRLDNHADHGVVEQLIFSYILLLVQDFNSFLIEFGLGEVRLYVLQVSKLDSSHDISLTDLNPIIFRLLLKRVYKTKGSIGDFKVVLKLFVETLKLDLILKEQLEKFKLPKYFNKLSHAISSVESILF